jgi:regulator of replication initiation timing
VDEIRLLAQIQELKDKVTALADENARLRAERDTAVAHLDSLLPVATPEEEEEMRRLMATAVPLDLPELIRDLEAGGTK